MQAIGPNSLLPCGNTYITLHHGLMVGRVDYLMPSFCIWPFNLFGNGTLTGVRPKMWLANGLSLALPLKNIPFSLLRSLLVSGEWEIWSRLETSSSLKPGLVEPNLDQLNSSQPADAWVRNKCLLLFASKFCICLLCSNSWLLSYMSAITTSFNFPFILWGFVVGCYIGIGGWYMSVLSLLLTSIS